MAGKDAFTEAEWETLQKGVTGAGFLVSVADASFFDTFKEAGAMAGHLSEARQKSSSQLVRELGETRGTGFSWNTGAQQVESDTLAALRSAVSILKSKAPDDVPAYNEFVLAVAESVAKAVKDVSAPETGAIDKIKAALDAPGEAEAGSQPAAQGG